MPIAPGQIVLQAPQQGRRERGAHERLRRRERIRDLDITLTRWCERGGVCLEKPSADERCTELVFEDEKGVVGNVAGPRRTQLRREFIVAVRARHLLDEIDLARNVVATKTRHPDVKYAVAVAREDRGVARRLVLYVVPVEDAVRGQMPVAFVVPSGDPVPTVDDVKQHTIANGPAYQHPRHVFFADILPLAGTNKVDRKQLAESAASRVATSA